MKLKIKFIFIIFYVVATIIRNNISNENNLNDEKTNLFIYDRLFWTLSMSMSI